MQHVRNYGSFLQAYALKTTLESFGHQCEFVDIEQGLGSPQVVLGKQGGFAGESEIGHEGQGVARCRGSRVHRVDEPLVAGGNPDTAHRGVIGGSGGMKVSHTIHGIGRIAVVGTVLGTKRHPGQEKGRDNP